MNYTHEQLSVAFDKVRNKEHWKNPIDAFCSFEDKDVVERAIIYFTGTPAFFTLQKNGLYHVQACGYRFGPAGDH